MSLWKTCMAKVTGHARQESRPAVMASSRSSWPTWREQRLRTPHLPTSFTLYASLRRTGCQRERRQTSSSARAVSETHSLLLKHACRRVRRHAPMPPALEPSKEDPAKEKQSPKCEGGPPPPDTTTPPASGWARRTARTTGPPPPHRINPWDLHPDPE